jgi:hypothetical protein
MQLGIFAALASVWIAIKPCDAQGGILRGGRAMSSDPSAYQILNSQPHDAVDEEVFGALLERGKSNDLVQMFNALTQGVSGISDAVEAQLSLQRIQDPGHDSTMVGADVPSHPLYDLQGMCPLEDFNSRKAAAEVVGSTLMKMVAVQNEFRTWAWRAGEEQPVNPAIDRSTVLDIMGMFVLLPSLALTDGGNRTTWFNYAARMNCWEPSPLFAGPMIFKYSSVYPRLTDPMQKRGYYTATAPQSPSFFSKDSPLFLDGERHQTVRQLLEKAGFARRYEVDQALIQAIPAVMTDSVSAETVSRAIIPALMKAVWGVEPPADVQTAVDEYGKYGKFAIFGQVIEDYALGPVGIAARIAENRKKVAEWATTSPFFEILRGVRDSDSAFVGHPWLLDSKALVANLADASLFAGLVGSTDLIQKCVNYQLRDANHKKMFEASPEQYLIELMRYDSAVTSVTEVLSQNITLIISGRKINFAAGTPVQLVLASANRDPLQFQSPDDFDPSRSELGDTLAWNGAARDVESRDFAKAPRHCPGFCLSLKLGAAVCAKMLGSYDTLRTSGKVGNVTVACANFGSHPEKDPWQPPSTSTPQPFYDYSDPSHDPVYNLIKHDAECKSPDVYIGKFLDVAACAYAVKASGGKFFIYGTGLLKGGWCYREWTRTSDCSEGFQSDWYDFYEIPEMRSDDILQCKVDVVAVSTAQSGSLLNRDDYREDAVALAEASGVVRGYSQRRYSCAWEHRMTCSAGSIVVNSYESCCSMGWWGSSCTIPTEKSLTEAATLSTRGQPWQRCKVSGVSSFRADPPSNPRLSPNLLEDDECLTLNVGGTSRTLREIFDDCPSWLSTLLNVFAEANKHSYDFYYALIPEDARNHPIAYLFGKSSESSLLEPQVFDTYTIGMTVAIIHMQLRNFEGSSKAASDLVAIPQSQDFLDRIFVNGFRDTAASDIDYPSSNGILDRALEFGQNCVMDVFREMDFNDGIQSGDNTWENLLGDATSAAIHCPNGQARCTKKDFILGVFANYTTQDGDPVYPAEQIDFRGIFHKAGMWDDAAERFLAFEHLAMHRTRALSSAEAPSHDGVFAAFVVSTSALGGLKTRAGFARLGADMFFSGAGEPIMIRTSDGQNLWRSEVPDVTWQYWKFVWRSSMFLYITLVDHLWMTHFSAGEALAGAIREGLPPSHPLRRLLSMATFGTIAVNVGATHTLIGPNHLLQRSTPFQDFHTIAQTASAAIQPMKEAYGAIVDDAIFEALHPTLQQLPFYQDGRLIFQAIQTLVDRYFDLYGSSWCGVDSGLVNDMDIKVFMQRLKAWTNFDLNAASDGDWLGLYSDDGQLLCKGFRKLLKTLLFAVSGYHRHVGTVGDIASDPDFASFSNVVGEPFGRPRQHLLMSLIAGSTARIMPKIVQDYTHLAADLGETSGRAAHIFKDFQDAILSVADEVDSRNEKRSIPYLQMHPRFVETSVAV